MNYYTEKEMIETISRLASIYSKSSPDEQQTMERFVEWVYSQYGYVHEKRQ